MNPEIVNLYIEKLLNEITELTKTKILLSTQLSYTEQINAQLNDKLQKLEASLNKKASKNKEEDF
jgi:hypothetical protein